jgi:hypothetical protein
METVYLHWNIVNWITVVLMALLGFMVLSFFAQLYRNKAGS